MSRWEYLPTDLSEVEQRLLAFAPAVLIHHEPLIPAYRAACEAFSELVAQAAEWSCRND